jgi:hypothetical protein
MAIQQLNGKWQVIIDGSVAVHDAGSRDKARAMQKEILAGGSAGNVVASSQAAPTKATKIAYYGPSDYATMLTKELIELGRANGVTGISKAARHVVLEKLAGVQIPKNAPVIIVAQEVVKTIPKASVVVPPARTFAEAPRYKPGCGGRRIYNTRWYGQPTDGYTLEVNGTPVGVFPTKQAVIAARDWCKQYKATSLRQYNR